VRGLRRARPAVRPVGPAPLRVRPPLGQRGALDARHGGNPIPKVAQGGEAAVTVVLGRREIDGEQQQAVRLEAERDVAEIPQRAANRPAPSRRRIDSATCAATSGLPRRQPTMPGPGLAIAPGRAPQEARRVSRQTGARLNRTPAVVVARAASPSTRQLNAARTGPGCHVVASSPGMPSRRQ
jgi:hypothetical protein